MGEVFELIFIKNYLQFLLKNVKNVKYFSIFTFDRFEHERYVNLFLKNSKHTLKHLKIETKNLIPQTLILLPNLKYLDIFLGIQDNVKNIKLLFQNIKYFEKKF